MKKHIRSHQVTCGRTHTVFPQFHLSHENKLQQTQVSQMCPEVTSLIKHSNQTEVHCTCAVQLDNCHVSSQFSTSFIGCLYGLLMMAWSNKATKRCVNKAKENIHTKPNLPSPHNTIPFPSDDKFL